MDFLTKGGEFYNSERKIQNYWKEWKAEVK